jgi:hypothetical protein
MTKPLPIFSILRFARDSHLVRNSELVLLYTLILRCDPLKGYSTFVSYDRLSQDTGSNPKTIQAAARGLETKGIITRRVRPKTTNLWFINVPMLQTAALASLEADATAPTESSPYDLGSLTDITEEIAPGCSIRPVRTSSRWCTTPPASLACRTRGIRRALVPGAPSPPGNRPVISGAVAASPPRSADLPSGL